MVSNTHVPVYESKSHGFIELMTHMLLQITSPDTLEAKKPFPIQEFCELGDMRRITGVSLVIVDEIKNSDGSEAAGEVVGDELILALDTYEKLEKGDPWARFTLAHELGHVILHRSISSLDPTKLNYKPYDLLPFQMNPEKQANYFAACLLMPTKAVAMTCRKARIGSIDDMARAISNTFNVSRSAAQRRIGCLERGGILRPPKNKAEHGARLRKFNDT